MNETFAYIDESGNEGMDLDKPNVSPTYVVVSMVVNSEQIDKVRTSLWAAKAKYFKNGEMKSATIGTNAGMRTHVLTDILAGDFLVFALVVDKTALRDLTLPGFQYPKSFIKNIQQRLYSRVLTGHQFIHVTADRIKNPAFTSEFRRYIEAHNESGLFRQWGYDLVDSAQDVFIQAADVIAGTIRMIFESDSSGDSQQVWRQQLQARLADLRVFPRPRLGLLSLIGTEATAEQDTAIERHALSMIGEFIDRNQDTSESDIRLQLECARTLYVTGYLRNSEEWISTNTITERLKAVAYPEEVISEQKVRSVVGRLRDAGLLIASRKAGGYKLPSSYEDMRCFVERQRTTIDPLMHRILLARRAVKVATNSGADILQRPEFTNLKAALDAGGEWLPTVGSPADIESQE